MHFSTIQNRESKRIDPYQVKKKLKKRKSNEIQILA